jgi:hypothetical protein
MLAFIAVHAGPDCGFSGTASYTERSKLLPDGGAFHTGDLSQNNTSAPAIHRLRSKDQRNVPRRFGPLARHLGRTIGRQGRLFGTMTARAEAHVMRLAMLHAVLDQSSVIKRTHL